MNTRFSLVFATGNAAMSTADDVALAIDQVAAAIRAGREGGGVMDENGNTIGTYRLTLPAPDDDHGFDA